MASQSDRIQSLVEQINAILADSSPSDPEMTNEYQVLEQTRQQLTQLQPSPTNAQSPLQTATDDSQLMVNDWQTPAPVLAESAQQVLQSIVQEMAYLRMNTVQPLREDITRLQQERSYLATEVQQLQQQRQQLILAQQTDQQQMINGFLHSLMGRLQEQLTQQVAQTMVSLKSTSAVPLVTSSNEQVVQLDSTLKVLFDSLQASVDTYQDSLEHSLRKMHGLGQQGEAMFTAFVNRLAGQLGREASLHLRPATSPGLELPTEEVRPALKQGIVDGAERPVGPEDEIAPAYLEQLLGETLEESANPNVAPLQASSLADVDHSTQPATDVSTSATQTAWDIGGGATLEPNPAANHMIDQIIDQLESNTIDAVAALDNLDLGFGLDHIELADLPMVPSPPSADQATFSTTDEGGDGSRHKQEHDVLNQLSQDPINVSSGLELDTPLDPIATIHLDEDESDVDRFMSAISQPYEDQATTVAPGLMAFEDSEQAISNHPLLRESGITSGMDGGIADVSQADFQTDDRVRDSDDDSDFLLQQLSSELYDDVLGEEFLDAPNENEGDMRVVQTSQHFSTASTVYQDGAGISFLINPPAQPSSPTSMDDSSVETPGAASEGDGLRPTEGQNIQDFYAPFSAASTTSNLNGPDNEGNTWSEWTNNLAHKDTGMGSILSQPQPPIPETTTPAPLIIDTIHSLSDLIESTGIASRPPVALSASGQTDHLINADRIGEQEKRESDILAGLDLRLDASTMSELADDLSDMDNPIDPYNDDLSSFSSDIANNNAPLPPPLSIPQADGLDLAPSALDNPGENAIETLQGLFSNGGNAETKSEPSLRASGDVNFDGQGDEGLFDAFGLDEDLPSNSSNNYVDDLTPVSWTLEELIENDFPFTEPATSVAKPINYSDSHSSPSEISTDSEHPNDLGQEGGEPFEDDGLENLVQDLQREQADIRPLSGAEEAKTLADLLRSQNSSSPSANASATNRDPSSSSSSLADWLGNDTEDSDELSDPEKKNNY